MTREEDAVAAVDFGADAVGMLFYDRSPRYVSNTRAAAIADSVKEKEQECQVVGLFVDADEQSIREVLADVAVDILQFHGNESQTFCKSFGLPFWKTVRAKEAAGLPEMIAAYPDAAGILLDTWHPTQAGGTGQTFDWTMLDGLEMQQHLILAGGLNPDNIREAVESVKPWAVDVCSGVEESPGIKSRALMQQFIEEVQRV